MSRRKQARPIRVLESEEGVGTTEVHNGPDLPSHWPPTNLGESSVSGSEDDCVSSGGLGESIRRLEDDPICEHCNAEFQSLQEALEHRKECTRRKELLGSPQSIENDDVASGDEEDEYGSILEEGVKRQEEVRRQRQDAENNNSVEDGETEGEGDTAEGELPLGFPFQLPAAAAAGHVTLEALQNTKVAVAQFVSTTMANNADNAAALQELAVLQSTLYTLQHQQMMQLNLIQQLQQQLQITRPKDGSPASPPPPSSIPLPISLPVQLTIRPQTPLPPPPPKPSRTPTPVKHEVPVTPPTTQSVPPSHSQTQTSTPKPITTSPPVQPVSLPPCSISSSFASSIITNLDPPSPNEPNTLEMLQRRAQEVLDNASQGLLANNLADELAFRKSGKGSMSPYDSKSGGRNEPFFKHRCRYCGKVFGSDSALQIHIRSHTGERPFKCNVCGSRFTTKGNLKVHFQRHTSKFPHIKMNPNPIPEHLDKYHPPLLAQMSAHQSLPPGVPPHHPHHPSQFPGSPPFPPTGLSLYRPQGPSPHDLVLPTHHSHHRPNDPLIKPMLPLPLFAPRGEQDMPENLSKPIPPSAHSSPPPPSEHSDRYKKEPPEETQPLSLSISDVTESMQRGEDRLTPKHEMEVDHNQDHERYPSPPYEDECSLDSKYSNEDLLGDPESPGMDKQEDSLQEQPENLSNKMRGNTTCNICFKTFACNSALEIHYRSHTKERPFKCTICDRGFSTKQHMLTHKIRDMPSHLFEQKLSHDEASNTSSDTRDLPRALSVEPSHTPIPIPPPQLPQPPPPHQNLLSMPHQPPPPLPPLNKEHPPPIKRSPPEGESVLPIPKRQPSLPKHLCHVCNKNFSSSSALQIHMRTHTGDKPFRCTICHKAFTTKGNLKVHMGTHMWTNGASRRGRRMSLDLPPLPITPKDSDFLHRRPDLFYPYLPAPFLNGMQQKLNEISVIQNVGNNMSNGLLGFGGYGSGVMSNEMKPNSPVSDKQPMSPPRHRTTPPLWDLHYERKPQHAPPDEQMDVCTSPPAPSHVAPPRGEGLAA
uniref:C2H2-type domain-containing protein n=1 Tax=Clastoptera arizonana TaxID=38151 RepID=A0A1B6CWS3_9HEMI